MYSKEELNDLSLIEMAHEYLKNSKQPIAFNDLVNEIKSAAEISDEEVRSRLAQFYTDLNIDGRFLALGENRWGLRVWYPVDTAEDEVVHPAKPKKKKAKKVVEEEDIELEDFEELEDEEDFDDLEDFVDDEVDLDEDEDEDDSFDEVDEIDEIDEEFDEDEAVIEEDEVFDLDEEDELDDDEALVEDEDEDDDEKD